MVVKLATEAARIILIDLKPGGGAWSDENPWGQLAVDSPLQLELDRRRHSDQGDLLAFAFLPNGRMPNAELIRLGLALPCSDGANVRYLDLFHELAADEEVGPCVGRPPSATPQFGLRRGGSPAERPPLGGLRLAGLIWDSSAETQEIRALVEAPDGLGYIVRLDDRRFGGQVIAIGRDRLRLSVIDERQARAASS